MKRQDYLSLVGGRSLQTNLQLVAIYVVALVLRMLGLKMGSTNVAEAIKIATGAAEGGGCF